VSSTECNNVNQFKFIFTRIHSGLIGSDADIAVCGTTARLPWETDVVLLRSSDCYVAISPGDASDKTTAAAAQQQVIYDKLKPILSCLS